MVLLADSSTVRPRDDCVHALLAYPAVVHARATRSVFVSVAGTSRALEHVTLSALVVCVAPLEQSVTPDSG